MGVVSYSKVNAMLIAIVNIDSQRRFTAGTIDSKKASPDQIKESVLISDSRVVIADADNPYHYRNLLPQAELDHGDSIPGGVMRPCTVLIKVNSADVRYINGIRGPWGADQIERWRRNHNNLYGPYAHNDVNSPLAGKICFKGNKLLFTGYKGRIMRAPEFVIDRTTPACQADESQTALVLSGGVFYLYQEGMVSDALFAKHEQIWSGGIAKLEQRALALLNNTEE